MLKDHGRYPYSPIIDRPVYDWPGGKRLAVYVALNIEVFPFADGYGTDLAPKQPHPDIVNFTWRDYGNRVGVWNLIDALDRYDLPASILLNTEVYDHCPQIPAAFRSRRDEFVGHGRTNGERQSDLDESGERRLIEETRDIIAHNEGAAPDGWLSPWLSETLVTPDLLHEAGYRYSLNWACDDQPFWMKTRNGRLLAVPYSRPTNDTPAMHRHSVMPSTYADIVIDQFDEMLEQSRARPLVFNLSLHPFMVGQPFRIRHLRRVFAHLADNRGAIWLARAGDIARYAQTLPDAILPG